MSHKGMVNLDRIQAGVNGIVENVKCDDTDLENGMVLFLGDMVDDEYQLYEVLKPNDGDVDLDKDPLYLHASPEVMYDPRDTGLENFYVPQGKAARAFLLQVGDEFQISANMIDNPSDIDIENGNYVYLAAKDSNDMKLEALEHYPGEESTDEKRFVAKAIKETKLGYEERDAFLLKVVKA